jgi:hypothetical protein
MLLSPARHVHYSTRCSLQHAVFTTARRDHYSRPLSIQHAESTAARRGHSTRAHRSLQDAAFAATPHRIHYSTPRSLQHAVCAAARHVSYSTPCSLQHAEFTTARRVHYAARASVQVPLGVCLLQPINLLLTALDSPFNLLFRQPQLSVRFGSPGTRKSINLESTLIGASRASINLLLSTSLRQ